jgi:perosamine synthetase
MKKQKIPWAEPVFSGQEKKYLIDALNSSWISGGPYVERFEHDFKKAIKSPYVITTSNGTTALLLAMIALGIGPGDEVIIPGFTFVAPANMVITLGAKPVFVDIDPFTWCLDPICIEEAITKKTKAICAVHLYGNVCDMKLIKLICQKHNLILIEDTAESAFSRYNGRYAGTLGDVGIFSFQATKTLTMGEGGCIAVNNKRLFEKMKIIRNHGMNRKKFYWHTEIGHNFRLTNIQAAIGCAQLDGIDKILNDKRRVCRSYYKFLNNIPGITLQQFHEDVDPVVWALALKIDPRIFGARDRLMAQMLKAGIETRPGFYPFATMPIYRKYVTKKLEVALDTGAHVLSLPSSPQLKEEEISQVCSTLASCRKS